MHTYRILPKLPLKTFACDGGYLRDTNRLVSLCMLPEIPLTRACNEEAYVKAPKLPSSYACRPKTLNSLQTKAQKNALNGLSNWYTNHLTAMNAIQKFPKFCKENDCETQNYYDKLANFNFSKSMKYKRQAAGPHIDLENYLNSLKSRQKELSDFRSQSRAWERYFERAIPGWTELKQHKEIDAKVMDKIIGGLHKLEKGSKTDLQLAAAPKENRNKRKFIKGCCACDALDSDHCSLPNGRKQYGAKKNDGVKLNDDFSALDAICKSASTPAGAERVAAFYADIENEARSFFQQLPVAKTEHKGHINNETIFNEVYGKYLEKPKGTCNSKSSKQQRKSNRLRVKESKSSTRIGGRRKNSATKLRDGVDSAQDRQGQPKLSSSTKPEQKSDATTKPELTSDPKAFGPTGGATTKPEVTSDQQASLPKGAVTSKTKPVLIEVTCDPSVFKQKCAAMCKAGALGSSTKVFLCGHKAMLPAKRHCSSKPPKTLPERMHINSCQMLVVENCGSNIWRVRSNEHLDAKPREKP